MGRDALNVGGCKPMDADAHAGTGHYGAVVRKRCSTGLGRVVKTNLDIGGLRVGDHSVPDGAAQRLHPLIEACGGGGLEARRILRVVYECHRHRKRLPGEQMLNAIGVIGHEYVCGTRGAGGHGRTTAASLCQEQHAGANHGKSTHSPTSVLIHDFTILPHHDLGLDGASRHAGIAGFVV